MLKNYENLKHYELIPYVNFLRDTAGFEKIYADNIIIYENTNFSYECGMFYYYFHFNYEVPKECYRIGVLNKFFSLYKDDLNQCCVNPYFFQNLKVGNYLVCSTKATIIFDIDNSDLDSNVRVSLAVASPDEFREDNYGFFDRILILYEFFQRHIHVQEPRCNMPVVNKRIIKFINNFMQQ